MTGFLNDPARAAAVAAARTRIEPGMTIGLGSGRAVFALIDLLATTWSSSRPLRAVVASARTEARARAAGIDLVDLDTDLVLDLAFDRAPTRSTPPSACSRAAAAPSSARSWSWPPPATS